MTAQNTCTYCQTAFIPRRKDAQYCSNSCRYKSAHQRRLAQEFEQTKEKQKAVILEEIIQLKEAHKQKKFQKEEIEKREKQKQAFFKTYHQVMKLSNEKLYPIYCEYELKKLPYQSNQWHELNDYLRFSSPSEQVELLKAFKIKLSNIKTQLEKK